MMKFLSHTGVLLKMRSLLILASALTSFPFYAHAASSIPNDCWFGVMARDKVTRGQLVARGPVAQWRVGMSLVFYPTKEDEAERDALINKGQTRTYDTSRPITVTPTWISGPKADGDSDSDAYKSIEVIIKYRDPQAETGVIFLTYWTLLQVPKETSTSDRQGIAEFNQLMHDQVCQGIP